MSVRSFIKLEPEELPVRLVFVFALLGLIALGRYLVAWHRAVRYYGLVVARPATATAFFAGGAATGVGDWSG